MKRKKRVKLRRVKRVKKQKHPFDRNFFYLVLSLVVVGLVFVADISAPQALTYFDDKFHFLKQQVVAAVVGVIAMIVISGIKYSYWKKIAVPFFGFSIILLIAVLIPGISYSALGARRWISVGGFNFQPSEVVKLSLALYLAKVSEMNKKTISYFVPLGIVAGLIMLQPDLGTTIIVATIGVAQIFVAGVPLLHFLGTVAVGIVGVVGLILSSSYRRDRLITFLQNTTDPLGKSYHIRQILLAMGSGGIFGVGLGQSKQKYLFLPEASTDSIFAAIAEEIGLIGGLAIILVFLYFVFKAFKIAVNAPDKFSKVLAVGITSWIGGQALLNFSSMVALTPLTGIPLPFFSFGGTSLVMVLVGCGILLNISRYETKKITSRR
ncbi:putative lipid II flippase FtsW [Candidatus Microgenomates bacterium]|nr:putative lipid II flippase FtsW [Candidatus Microgenomates bacterium]